MNELLGTVLNSPSSFRPRSSAVTVTRPLHNALPHSLVPKNLAGVIHPETGAKSSLPIRQMKGTCHVSGLEDIGQNGNVFQHGLPAIAETCCLHRRDFEQREQRG